MESLNEEDFGGGSLEHKANNRRRGFKGKESGSRVIGGHSGGMNTRSEIEIGG